MSREIYMKYFVVKMNQAIDLTTLLTKLDKLRGNKYIVGKELAECILEAMIM